MKMDVEDFQLPSFTGTEPCADQWHLFHGEWGERNRTKHERESLAVALCGGCPALDACALWGILHERHGVWGGLTENDRGAIRSRQGIRLVTPEAATQEKDRAIIRARKGRIVT